MRGSCVFVAIILVHVICHQKDDSIENGTNPFARSNFCLLQIVKVWYRIYAKVAR